MSLANIQGKLSRSELKNIMAGSGGAGGGSCATKSCNDCGGSYGGGESCTNSYGQVWGKNYTCYNTCTTCSKPQA